MAEELERSDLLAAIEDLRSREPFKPFCILVSSGREYRIEKPGNLIEMKTEFFYAFPGGEGFVFIRKNQIVAVENGRPAKRRKRSA